MLKLKHVITLSSKKALEHFPPPFSPEKKLETDIERTPCMYSFRARAHTYIHTYVHTIASLYIHVSRSEKFK